MEIHEAQAFFHELYDRMRAKKASEHRLKRFAEAYNVLESHMTAMELMAEEYRYQALSLLERLQKAEHYVKRREEQAEYVATIIGSVPLWAWHQYFRNFPFPDQFFDLLEKARSQNRAIEERNEQCTQELRALGQSISTNNDSASVLPVRPF